VGYAGTAQVGKGTGSFGGQNSYALYAVQECSRQALSLGNMPPEMTALLAISQFDRSTAIGALSPLRL